MICTSGTVLSASGFGFVMIVSCSSKRQDIRHKNHMAQQAAEPVIMFLTSESLVITLHVFYLSGFERHQYILCCLRRDESRFISSGSRGCSLRGNDSDSIMAKSCRKACFQVVAALDTTMRNHYLTRSTLKTSEHVEDNQAFGLPSFRVNTGALIRPAARFRARSWFIPCALWMLFYWKFICLAWILLDRRDFSRRMYASSIHTVVIVGYGSEFVAQSSTVLLAFCCPKIKDLQKIVEMLHNSRLLQRDTV